MLEEILDVLTDKAPDRSDGHFDEYVRECHDGRLREIISDQSIILTTGIPEPFRVWEASAHTHLKRPQFIACSLRGVIFITDETSGLLAVRQKKPADIEPRGTSLTFMRGVIISGHFVRPPNMLTKFFKDPKYVD